MLHGDEACPPNSWEELIVLLWGWWWMSVAEPSAAKNPMCWQQVRGWKLFLLIPRLFLALDHRGAGLIPRMKLRERFEKFSQGRWFELQIAGGTGGLGRSHDTSTSRRRRRSPDSIVHRVARAKTLTHLGELSAARNALEGAPCAPGDNITLRALQDESHRPKHPRFPVPREVLEHRPEVEPALDRDWFLVSLRTARKGAAGGPSGMTAEHLRVLLRNERDSDLLYEMVLDVVRADISDEVLEAIRIGRMVALQKPGGGVRGIVVGDILRRLVARTLAQELSVHIEAATSPFQYALTTRSGCECIAHAVQALSDADPEATVLSVDGIGAFDLISRAAMLTALRDAPGCDRALHLCANFTVVPRSISGRMISARPMKFCKAREGNRETPSCLPCSHLVNIEPSLQRSPRCTRPPSWWRSRMMCTWSAALHKSLRVTHTSSENCGHTRASGLIWARPRFLTGQAFFLLIASTSFAQADSWTHQS